jgi:hypothetical protein
MASLGVTACHEIHLSKTMQNISAIDQCSRQELHMILKCCSQALVILVIACEADSK